jgi:hypothetical protein
MNVALGNVSLHEHRHCHSPDRIEASCLQDSKCDGERACFTQLWLVRAFATSCQTLTRQLRPVMHPAWLS